MDFRHSFAPPSPNAAKSSFQKSTNRSLAANRNSFRDLPSWISPTIRPRVRPVRKQFWGLKAGSECSCSTSAARASELVNVRIRNRRNNVCVILAATYSNVEADASVEKREIEESSRSLENSEGFRSRRREDEVDDWGTESEMLRLIEESKDYYPMVRTYRNNLCTLELCGSAKRSQTLAALASDRSYTAATNLLRGRPLTVLQTVLPGCADNHSTISTKLFAPSSLVVETAKKFTLPNGVAARDFVHRLFEAVQMQNLSKFYLDFHVRGTKRDMTALAKEERVQAMCVIESSNRNALSDLAKAVSLYAVACIQENTSSSYHQLPNVWKMWQKPQWVPNAKATVRICTLSEVEISTQAKLLHIPAGETMNMEKEIVDHTWWPAPSSSRDAIGKLLGHGLEHWAHAYLPIHKLWIDSSMPDTTVTEGQRVNHAWEILLSHAQLVDLASILDLYYEDRFTCPDKILKTGAMLNLNHSSRSKVSQFVEIAALATFMVGAAIFAWVVAARFRRLDIVPRSQVDHLRSSSTTLVDSSKELKVLKNGVGSKSVLPINEKLSAAELEALCRLVVAEVMIAFEWSGEIQSSTAKGAWIGQENFQWNSRAEDVGKKESHEVSEFCSSENGCNDPARESFVSEDEVTGNRNDAEEVIGVASSEGSSSKVQPPDVSAKSGMLYYQVSLSRNGDILGFMPLNQTAVTFWANMPFSEILHKGHKLHPGFFEQPLKFTGPPTDSVVLELCLSNDPPSAHARSFVM